MGALPIAVALTGEAGAVGVLYRRRASVWFGLERGCERRGGFICTDRK